MEGEASGVGDKRDGEVRVGGGGGFRCGRQGEW